MNSNIECPFCHSNTELCFYTYLTGGDYTLVCKLCGAWVYCDITGKQKGEWHSIGEECPKVTIPKDAIQEGRGYCG